MPDVLLEILMERVDPGVDHADDHIPIAFLDFPGFGGADMGAGFAIDQPPVLEQTPCHLHLPL